MMKDQGSVGCSGSFFLMALGFLVLTAYDWFHRVKNDIFLAAKHSHGGRGKVFRTMLEMAMVMNINYNPFGTGGWHATKKETLREMKARSDCSHPLFVELAGKIGRDFGMPTETHEDREAVWKALDEMPSFEQKGPVCKFKRFMSLSECWEFYKNHLWGLKLVLQWAKGGSEADAHDLDEVRCGSGGVRGRLSNIVSPPSNGSAPTRGTVCGLEFVTAFAFVSECVCVSIRSRGRACGDRMPRVIA